MLKKIAKHINTYCTYCKESGIEKTKAIWRISYDGSKRACNAHQGDLLEYEKKRRQIDDNLSEADYQTWMRL